MIIKNIFGGCNIKSKTSCVHNGIIYYCSNTNILITNEIQVKEVVYLENYLNFVKVQEDDFLISGDVMGNLYVINKKGEERWMIEKTKFMESLQDGCFINSDLILCVFLKSVILYNVKTKENVSSIQLESLISTSCYFSELIFLGMADGDILAYNTDLKLKFTIRAHDDRVQDINPKIINGVCYLASSSKDGTVKIWEYNYKTLTHKQTLVGHNDWVYQINWTDDNSVISASADKSIMIWRLTGFMTWECESILGGAKPFINAFSFRECIIGQSHSGSFYKFDECINDFISGHISEVTSLDWNDEYLLSTSLDKTARIFYGNREIGRPMIHGYELTSGRFINENSLSIIIGAQETIIRVLEPTYIFYLSCEWMKNNLKQIEDLQGGKYFENIEDLKIAAVPAELSLTNDAIEDYDFENVNEYLLSTTTFLETRKLYGHYFEISDIVVSKNFIASCNKSLTKKFGGIFLWNKKYEVLDYFEVHAYGIIKLKFSPNEKYLCSVSKDKTSSIYEITERLNLQYRNFDHKRIVWDCAFSYDSKYYATCSRDRKICIYDLVNNNLLISTLEFNEEVTALDFSPVEYLLLAGTEKGEIYKIILNDSKFEIISNEIIKGHSQSVNVLRFNSKGTKLATGGKDGLINIFEI